jgi:nitrogen fixation protein NifU and related proteins
MKKMYTKELIEHYKSPKRFGKMENPDLVGSGINSLCGDEITVYVKNEEGRVSDVSFEGSGCAICIGVMSMIIDSLVGKNIYELPKMQDSTALELIGMQPDSPRVRCATLSIESIRNIH